MVRETPLAAGRLAAALLASLALAATGAEAVDQLNQVVVQRVNDNELDAESQLRIDTLSDETDKMVAEYRGLLKQIDALRIYNRQAEGLVASQDEEMASLRQQIDDVKLVSRQVIPLMLEMIAALEEFVDLDYPFLFDERTSRIAALRELMARADVTDAERFRRILEAYQIENEYGRTIEAYTAELALDGKVRTVELLRVGRIVLIYQTRDRSEAGVWDQQSHSWKPLSSDYRSAVRQGLQIARKQVAPDLLRLPVPAPEPVR